MIDNNIIFSHINTLGKKHGANKILLFGSRTGGDHRDRSDIDIAVYGVSEDKKALFTDKVEHLPTLIDFDVVFITDKTAPELLSNIERDGINIMNKFIEKKNKVSNAIARLEEAIQDYEKYQNSSIRDSVIQRFEFCTELAWKATREYLINEGYTDINSTKDVMRQAHSDN